MNTTSPLVGLEQRIVDFAAAWDRLGAPGVGDDLLADPVLVLGEHGTSAVPRQAFLAAVSERYAAVRGATTATATLAGTTPTLLGSRLVLATITWTFGSGAGTALLISDFLLQREDDDRLRCVAYLPRTSVLDHLH
ncbi:MAG: hypothetical protein KQH57_00560 [Actinomycetales bacterium]|nr:hypothetical protein [Actinomycetales bacterium]